jgi:hypothetical protein
MTTAQRKIGIRASAPQKSIRVEAGAAARNASTIVPQANNHTVTRLRKYFITSRPSIL